MTVRDIFNLLQEFAPFETQMGFDNAGLLIGSLDEKVTKVGVALDVTTAVVEDAVMQGVDCIVSHHPIIFSGLKQIAVESPVYQAIKNGIAVISAHTNLDAAVGGVNDELARKLQLSQVEPLALPGESTPAMGRIGRLPASVDTSSFCRMVAETLGVRVKFSNVQKEIGCVAVCGGAGGDFMAPALAAGADALVTADVKHHEFLQAGEHNFLLVDAGHYETEYPVVQVLLTLLSQRLPVTVVELKQEVPVAYC